MAKNKKIKFRHYILLPIVKFISFLISLFKLGYKKKGKYKIKKGEQVLILSNHQTDFDPFLVIRSFNKPIYCIGTDNIIASKFGHMMENSFGLIPKHKGTSDIRTTKNMLQVVKEGGSILLFPEGNRTYAEFQYYIAPTIIHFLRKTKINLVLFKFEGGNGVWPRFAKKRRKGPFYGKISRVITYDEYQNYSDEELLNIIKTEIKQYDSDSNCLYPDKDRAEYIERIFFACPKCKKLETIYSIKEKIKCHNCDLDVEYTPNVRLDGNIEFTRLIDWWNFQKRVIKDLDIINDEIIFSDLNVSLKTANMYEKKQLLFKGNMSITDKYLIFGNDIKFDLAGIENASIIGGIRLSFTHDGKNYLIVGHKRFNPLKYIFLFNKLDTKMKNLGSDDYFNLKED